MIKPWIFEFFGTPDSPGGSVKPQEAAEYFSWYLDLWTRAEQLGFEGIFFSEHHFGATYSPAPNLLVANVAARTSTLRLGVMGMAVVYYSPWRVFEEIAMLDHLTGGRLEIGTAGGIPPEMAKVGLGYAEANERYAEALEILDLALSQPVISHHGKFWNFDDLHLVPQPLQQPSPPKWTTVVSVGSARKAARRGSKICTGFHSIDRVREIFDAYRDEAERVGQPSGPEQLAVRRQVIFTSSENEVPNARNLGIAALRSLLAADPRHVAPDAPHTSGTFAVGEEEFVVGTPLSVAEQIIEQCERIGAGHFLALFSGHAGREQISRTYEQFGAEVIPVISR